MNWAIKTKGDNQRRACALAGINPRVYRRRSKRPADTELRVRMKELASERRRFGYCRLHILLKREGYNHHRPHSSLAGLTPHEYVNRSKEDQNLNRANQ